MGNCATCCGKADPNEITTEKSVTKGVKGVQNEGYGANAGYENAGYPGKYGGKEIMISNKV
jgi:hypothetical protein